MPTDAAAPFDLVILGDLVLPDAVLPGGYVAVRGEAIAAIGQGVPPPAASVADHSGMLVLPGLVDGHMHTSSSAGWPGIEGATMSAAAGGVTTCVDMPYDVPRPVTDVGHPPREGRVGGADRACGRGALRDHPEGGRRRGHRRAGGGGGLLLQALHL